MELYPYTLRYIGDTFEDSTALTYLPTISKGDILERNFSQDRVNIVKRLNSFLSEYSVALSKNRSPIYEANVVFLNISPIQ